jgi:uncharacterized protein (TIGR02145 family)
MNYRFFVLMIFVFTFLFSCGDDKTTNPIDNIETVTIGTQIWMCKNLDVDHYRNGEPIPEVQDVTAWSHLTTGAWCFYNNDPANGEIYGKLYNAYAVNDPRGLAPEGYHIPSDAEWKELEMCLGMSKTEADEVSWRGTDEGGKLKETGISHWLAPNTGATNSCGFSGLPGGCRNNGAFNYDAIRGDGLWWSSTKHDGEAEWFRVLDNLTARMCRGYSGKVAGFSVRCVRDK